MSITNPAGCSTTKPGTGLAVALSCFCFQPVTDKEKEQGGRWISGAGEIRKMKIKSELWLKKSGGRYVETEIGHD